VGINNCPRINYIGEAIEVNKSFLDAVIASCAKSLKRFCTAALWAPALNHDGSGPAGQAVILSRRCLPVGRQGGTKFGLI